MGRKRFEKSINTKTPNPKGAPQSQKMLAAVQKIFPTQSVERKGGRFFSTFINQLNSTTRKKKIKTQNVVDFSENKVNVFSYALKLQTKNNLERGKSIKNKLLLKMQHPNNASIAPLGGLLRKLKGQNKKEQNDARNFNEAPAKFNRLYVPTREKKNRKNFDKWVITNKLYLKVNKFIFTTPTLNVDSRYAIAGGRLTMWKKRKSLFFVHMKKNPHLFFKKKPYNWKNKAILSVDNRKSLVKSSKKFAAPQSPENFLGKMNKKFIRRVLKRKSIKKIFWKQIKQWNSVIKKKNLATTFRKHQSGLRGKKAPTLGVGLLQQNVEIAADNSKEKGIKDKKFVKIIKKIKKNYFYKLNKQSPPGCLLALTKQKNRYLKWLQKTLKGQKKYISKTPKGLLLNNRRVQLKKKPKFSVFLKSKKVQKKTSKKTQAKGFNFFGKLNLKRNSSVFGGQFSPINRTKSLNK